jgi:hypothetical protein
VTSVRGTLSFWVTYEALDDRDPRRVDVRRKVFSLVEHGGRLPGVRSNRWRFGGGWYEGFEVPLENDAGYIAAAVQTDRQTGEEFVALLYLILYPER